MIPNARRPLPGLALAALLALPAAARAQSNVLDLAIGDPARRDRTAPVVLDGVTDAATGDVVTPPELAARLDPVSLLFLGESHTDIEFHQVQLRVLEELRKRGRAVLIGLEMYPAGEQAMLDRWTGDAGLTEADFLKESRWYHNWGYHWEYYRAIFRFARENGARMFGLNVPRAVVQTARKQGLEALTPEQRALLPERIDTDSEEHRTLFKAFFSAEDMHGQLPPEMFEGMFVAQCTWDGAMAHNAIRALRAAQGERPIMVVLIGSGHVAYGLGAERQAKLWYDGRIASVIPIPVYDTEKRAAIEKARASYANFFWGVPAATDRLFPVLGLSAPERDPGAPMAVIQVEKESVAEAAGFAVGDVLVAMDGTPIDQKETFNRLMSEKRWGDSARFEVRRSEETKTLTAYFRRKFEVPPAPCAPAPAADATPAAATRPAEKP
jgi:uncharacterized iron-regulated protein